MTSINQHIEVANAHLLVRWQQPSPGFAAGNDQRSSERGLLALLHGCMAHAARYQWLNGGRTLVDKTYLSIFWSALALERPGIGFDALAANLDSFIRQHLADQWHELTELDHEDRHQLAISLVETASQQLFGSQHSESAASQLLFFLCPELPLFPYSDAHADGAGMTVSADSAYRHYHHRCRERLALQIPLYVRVAPPSADESPALAALLDRGDWWQRRLLTQQFLNLQ